jgi:glutamyl-tRNA(Gln) amidotransferase subunit E
VRRVLPDGSTEFLRPLPGASRMYPETDVIPIKTDELLEEVKKNLPETFTERIKKYQNLGLSKNLAKQVVNSDYSEWFEKFVQESDIDPTLVASVFVNTLAYLEGEDLDVDKLTEKDFKELFKLISAGEVMKESIDDVLRLKLKNEKLSVKECAEKLGIETISEDELRELVKEIITKNKDAPKGKIIGFVMAKVRGKVDPKDVMRLVGEEMG